jgi:hypothetical protein
MNSRWLAAVLVVVSTAGLGSPAFADRTMNWPEGSIFLQPNVPPSSPASRAPSATSGPSLAAQPAPAPTNPSPLNPLDAPDAPNVWKPSNRDAGNLSEQRWKAYRDQRAKLPNSAN